MLRCNVCNGVIVITPRPKGTGNYSVTEEHWELDTVGTTGHIGFRDGEIRRNRGEIFFLPRLFAASIIVDLQNRFDF